MIQFDRLLFKAHEIRNMDLMERARIAQITVAAGGFGGKDAGEAFKKMEDLYAPSQQKEAREAQTIEQSAKALQRLFGGGR
jgi:hypothetical protein